MTTLAAVFQVKSDAGHTILEVSDSWGLIEIKMVGSIRVAIENAEKLIVALQEHYTTRNDMEVLTNEELMLMLLDTSRDGHAYTQLKWASSRTSTKIEFESHLIPKLIEALEAQRMFRIQRDVNRL